MKDVISNANPCKQIWLERKDLGEEGFFTAIYQYALTDPGCDYSYKQKPLKPHEFQAEEMKFKIALEKILDADEKWKAKVKFLDQVRTRYKDYFKSLDEVEFDNKSNVYFLMDIAKFFSERNPALACRAREIIKTHQQAGFE